jgi:hypothetical protein
LSITVSAQPREEPEGLQDLQIRVVRISELGGRQAAPSSENLLDLIPLDEPAAPPPKPELPPQVTVAASAPAPARPPAAPAAAPAAPAAPAASPASPASPSPAAAAPAPTAVTAPSARTAPAAQPGAPADTPVPASSPAVASRTAPLAAASRVEPEIKPKRRLITAGRVFSLLVVALLYVGWNFPTERYITPKRGMGYALGIIGGSLMLVLLLYSLRKRYTWLRFLGPTPSWFRFHMVLGVLGPLCILYHSNFTTGATNSNVALFAMLTVAGSGLIGRYIYAHIHHGLYGRKLQLSELRARAENLHALSGRIGFLPELVSRLESAEQRLLKSGPKAPVLGFAKPAVVAVKATVMRWRLHFYVRRSLRAVARRSTVMAAERQHLQSVACAYVDRRLAASRRVAGFEGYERLFSLWHALHIPLIFMMIIAAVIHIVAVHVY